MEKLFQMNEREVQYPHIGNNLKERILRSMAKRMGYICVPVEYVQWMEKLHSNAGKLGGSIPDTNPEQSGRLEGISQSAGQVKHDLVKYYFGS